MTWYAGKQCSTCGRAVGDTGMVVTAAVVFCARCTEALPGIIAAWKKEREGVAP